MTWKSGSRSSGLRVQERQKRLWHGVAFLVAALCLTSCEPEKQRGISFLAWSPDGQSLASIYQGVLFISEAHEFGSIRGFQKLELTKPYVAWSPDSKEIAFASKAAGSWDIWTINVKKGEKKQITHHPAKEDHPVWASTGKGFYFVSWRSGQPDIWYFDLKARKEYPLTSDSLEEMSITISRNGERICYLAEDQEGRKGLYVIDLTAQQRLCLVEPTNNLSEAVISPLGDQVAYVDHEGIHVIEVRFCPTKAPALVKVKDTLIVKRKPQKTGGAEELANLTWSYTGKEVAFVRSGGIFVTSLGFFGGTRPLVLSPGGDSLPTCASRNSRVAYAAGTTTEHPALAIVDPQKNTRDWLVSDLATAVEAAKYCQAVRSVDEAIRLLEQALRDWQASGPARDEAIELLSSMYIKRGQYDKLLAIHQEVTTDYVALGLVYMFCYQNFEQARLNLAKVAAQSQEAARYLKILKEYPPDKLRLYCASELAKRRGEYGKAVDYMKRFLRAAPDSSLAEPTAFQLGDVYWRDLKQPEKALQAYAEAIQRYPKSSLVQEARRSRAKVLWKGLRRADEAVRELQAVVEKLEPDERVECLKEMAQIWSQSGDTRGAVNADWMLIAELIRQDHVAQDQTPSQIEFRDHKRLGVFLESVKRAIGAKDLSLALENAARLPDLKLRSDEARRVALPRIVIAFDEAGLHEQANALIKNPALKTLISFTFDQTAPEWLRAIYYAPKETLIEARLGTLPAWIVARLDFLIAHVQSQPPTNETKALLGMLRMTVAHTPEEVEAIARSLPTAKTTKKGEVNHLQLAQVTAAYILGNYYQTRGETAKALDYYERMIKLMSEDTTFQQFSAATFIFSKCRRLLDAEPAAVKKWLDIERRAGQTIWGALELILPEGDRSGEYAEFLAEHPGSALADDAYYRLATLGNERYRERYYKKLLSSFPASPLFDAAFRDLEEFYALNGNDWLTARFAEELEKLTEQARNTAFLELEQGRVYAEALKRPDLAMPHLNVVLTKYSGTDEWAEAKQVAAIMAYGAKRWAEALAHIQEVMKKRPDFEWVTNGEALLKLAECEEKLDVWPEAEKAYVKFILTRRDRLEVSTSKLLAEKMGKLTNAARREIFEAHPEDFVKALPALTPGQQQELFKMFPELKEMQQGKEKKPTRTR